MSGAKIILLVIVLIGNVSRIHSQISWSETAPGVWKATAGVPENYDLLRASGATPNREALSAIAQASFPLSQADISIKVIDGKTYLRFPLQKEEQLFGFGLNFQTIHQRGKILQLHVDHYGGKDNGRTHAPTPFYVSSKGYGVFVNSARYINVYAGSGVRKDSKDPPVERDRNTEGKWWAARP